MTSEGLTIVLGPGPNASQTHFEQAYQHLRHRKYGKTALTTAGPGTRNT